MARLVPFSLQVGQRIDIQGVIHRISRVVPSSPYLFLQREDGSSTDVQTTRNELATLVVTERAAFVDELDEPSPEPLRRYTDISQLTVQRMFDWQAKVFLIRAMLPCIGTSPKSALFRQTFDAALNELDDYYQTLGMSIGSGWSPWTTYHDMLRWRANRFEIGAIQTKGVEYSPWTTRNALHVLAQVIANEVKREQPNLSVAGVHKKVNEQLAQRARSGKGL